MARDNYSYKKYQKELAKKKRNDEKKQRNLDKKNIQAAPAADPGRALNEDVAAV